MVVDPLLTKVLRPHQREVKKEGFHLKCWQPPINLHKYDILLQKGCQIHVRLRDRCANTEQLRMHYG